MDLTVRPIGAGEISAFGDAIAFGFGVDPWDEDTLEERFKATLELPRTVAAFDGDEIVGTSGAFTFDVGVPGGVAPMAGTTVVTVRATHRRRGVLNAMMRAHLDEAREHGDVIAGLWASEAVIYGRYGFGSASDSFDMSFNAATVGMRRDMPTDGIHFVDVDEAKKVIPSLYDGFWRERPGALSRSENWWNYRRFDDPERFRDGATARRYAIATDGSTPRGYVMFRQKEKWEDGHPHGEVRIVELIGLDAAAESALWDFIANIDLFPNVSWWNAPLDITLPWEVANPRGITRKLGDTLWLRLIDVEAALVSRTYSHDGEITIGLADEFLGENSGVYRLAVDNGSATCERTTDDPDVTLGMPALGALYLGGRSALTLALAGRVSGPAEAVSLLDEMFHWPVVPWCPEVF